MCVALLFFPLEMKYVLSVYVLLYTYLKCLLTVCLRLIREQRSLNACVQPNYPALLVINHCSSTNVESMSRISVKII